MKTVKLVLIITHVSFVVLSSTRYRLRQSTAHLLKGKKKENTKIKVSQYVYEYIPVCPSTLTPPGNNCEVVELNRGATAGLCSAAACVLPHSSAWPGSRAEPSWAEPCRSSTRLLQLRRNIVNHKSAWTRQQLLYAVCATSDFSIVHMLLYNKPHECILTSDSVDGDNVAAVHRFDV